MEKKRPQATGRSLHVPAEPEPLMDESPVIDFTMPPPVRYVAVGSLVYYIPQEVQIAAGEALPPEVLAAVQDTDVFRWHVAHGHIEIR